MKLFKQWRTRRQVSHIINTITDIWIRYPGLDAINQMDAGTWEDMSFYIAYLGVVVTDLNSAPRNDEYRELTHQFQVTWETFKKRRKQFITEHQAIGRMIDEMDKSYAETMRLYERSKNAVDAAKANVTYN